MTVESVAAKLAERERRLRDLLSAAPDEASLAALRGMQAEGEQLRARLQEMRRDTVQDFAAQQRQALLARAIAGPPPGPVRADYLG